MKIFLRKVFGFALIGIIPVMLLLTAGYFYYDPFKILYKYNDYSYYPPAVTLNRDYVTTEMFLKNNPKYKYNSFIFGSSRTSAYRIVSWRKYLPKDASPFSFDAAGESVYGIYTKLKYLDAHHAPIDNALLLMDRDWSFLNDANHHGYMFIKHPEISGESYFNFHKAFIDIYIDKEFLKAYYGYKLTHDYKDWMWKVLMNFKLTYDTVTNETNMVSTEIEIKADPAKFYNNRKDVFYTQKGETIDTVQRINEKHLFMLKEINRILEKNKTNYKIVLNPTYDQIKFSPHDEQILKDLFGNKLFDFTGKNQFTSDKMNFYETHHFRPNVGDSILSTIYK